MVEDIQAAIPMGFLLSFVIGPVFFVLLETSATKGFRAGLALDLGVILADILFLTIAYFSSFQLLENLSNQPGLYVFGGVILLVYGITNFFNRGISRGQAAINPRSDSYLYLFIKGFLLNLINVGVLVFWLGVIIIVGPSLNNDPNRIITFFAGMLGAYLFMDIVKILLAKQLKTKLTLKRILMVKKALGILLIISGLILITKGFLPMDKLNIERGIEIIRDKGR